MLNLEPPQFRSRTYDWVENFDESEEFGLFLAHLRHYWWAQGMTASTQHDLPAYPGEGRQRLIWVDGRVITAQITHLDRLIASEPDLHHFWHELSIRNHPPYRFWNQWRADLDVIVHEIADLPPGEIQRHVWDDIYYAYVENFERLSRRLGPTEFAAMTGVSEVACYTGEDGIPDPAERASSIPLWTVGQAEVLIWERQKNADPPTWTRMRSAYAATQHVKFDVQGEGENAEGSFFNSDHRYVHLFLDLADLDVSDDDVDRVCQFITQRVPVHPEVDVQMGRRRLRQRRWQAAETYLQRAIATYDARIPEDFEGLLDRDGCEQYWLATLYLAYIQYRKGHTDDAMQVLQHLGDQFNAGDVDELLTELNERPDAFDDWFTREFVDDRPLLLPPFVIPPDSDHSGHER